MRNSSTRSTFKTLPDKVHLRSSKYMEWDNSVKIEPKPDSSLRLSSGNSVLSKLNSPSQRKSKVYNSPLKPSLNELFQTKINHAAKMMKQKDPSTPSSTKTKAGNERGSNPNANYDPLVCLWPRKRQRNPYTNLYQEILRSISKGRNNTEQNNEQYMGDSNADITSSTMEIPGQLATKTIVNEIQGRRNTALLRIWTDSGPFSRVDAMTLAASVLEQKLTVNLLYADLSPEKKNAFNQFCEDMKSLLNLEANVRQIDTIDYMYLWHLYGIYTSSMVNEKCVETMFYNDRQPEESQEPSLCSLENMEDLHSRMPPEIPKDMDGVYAYFNLTTDNATQLLTSVNPALSECLSEPLQSFLVVYWRFVELGNHRKCKFLNDNPLNTYVKVLYQLYTNPQTTWKYITYKRNMTDRQIAQVSSYTTPFNELTYAALQQQRALRAQSNSAMKHSPHSWKGDHSETFKKSEAGIKKSRKTICLEGCRYDVVRRIALEAGFREVNEAEIWNVIWTDIPLSLDRGLEMRRLQDANYIYTFGSPPLQKANHFPGMNEICRKDRLARNLNRMKNIFGKEYEFFPNTWCLPSDLPQLMAHSKSQNKPQTYICKPDSGAQGKGIFLIRNLKKLNPFVRLICQQYLPRPLLIDGYKFDLRIYTLITCCDPLRIYVYDEGLARFATVKYSPPDDENISVAFMHLTNYSLNKFSQSYNPEGEGSKRKMSSVFNSLRAEGVNVQVLMDSIDAVVIKTIIAAQPTLKQYYRASFPKAERPSSCFEILGFDILIDTKLNVFLLEVNHSPSFNLDLAVDAEVKESLLRDTFAIIHLANETTRISKKQQDCYTLFGQVLSRSVKSQFDHEARNQGRYRLIYPTESYSLYDKYFEQSRPHGNTKFHHVTTSAALAIQKAAFCLNISTMKIMSQHPLGPKAPKRQSRVTNSSITTSALNSASCPDTKSKRRTKTQ